MAQTEGKPKVTKAEIIRQVLGQFKPPYDRGKVREAARARFSQLPAEQRQGREITREDVDHTIYQFSKAKRVAASGQSSPVQKQPGQPLTRTQLVREEMAKCNGEVSIDAVEQGCRKRVNELHEEDQRKLTRKFVRGVISRIRAGDLPRLEQPATATVQGNGKSPKSPPKDVPGLREMTVDQLIGARDLLQACEGSLLQAQQVLQFTLEFWGK